MVRRLRGRRPVVLITVVVLVLVQLRERNVHRQISSQRPRRSAARPRSKDVREGRLHVVNRDASVGELERARVIVGIRDHAACSDNLLKDVEAEPVRDGGVCEPAGKLLLPTGLVVLLELGKYDPQKLHSADVEPLVVDAVVLSAPLLLRQLCCLHPANVLGLLMHVTLVEVIRHQHPLAAEPCEQHDGVGTDGPGSARHASRFPELHEQMLRLTCAHVSAGPARH
mmetsp:Transcript_42775/g.141633  ORF Transcript_42775/g.141633 Transcript_42775/m.141633 type:complete len:226 (-) Transcript_42775:191-868(-)